MHAGVLKMWYMRTMKYYSASKRKTILSHATTWVNPGGMLRKSGESRQGKGYVIPLIATPRAVGVTGAESGSGVPGWEEEGKGVRV